MKLGTLFNSHELKLLPINYKIMRIELKSKNHEIDDNYRFSQSKIHRTKSYGCYPSLIPSVFEKNIVKK